ncbi:MAG: hypothetical protein AABZ64_11020 [Nitrospinota bacterium]
MLKGVSRGEKSQKPAALHRIPTSYADILRAEGGESYHGGPMPEMREENLPPGSKIIEKQAIISIKFINIIYGLGPGSKK